LTLAYGKTTHTFQGRSAGPEHPVEVIIVQPGTRQLEYMGSHSSTTPWGPLQSYNQDRGNPYCRIHSEARELNQLRYSIPLYVHFPRHFSTRNLQIG